MKPLDQFGAAQYRHHQVGDHDIRERVRLDEVERSFAVRGLDDQVARGLEEHPQKGSNAEVVIDDQDRAQAGLAAP